MQQAKIPSKSYRRVRYLAPNYRIQRQRKITQAWQCLKIVFVWLDEFTYCKIQSHAVTLTLIIQCPISNSSELFPYTTICSSFKWIEALFFELSCTQTDRHTDRRTDRHTDNDKYSIVAVEKPQL